MEFESSEESVTVGAPRGGPIFQPDMVGDLSTVPEFQSSYLDLLQDLETRLSLDSPSSSHQFDISTDDLKIYTEEELTDMAMKEAFKEEEDDVLQIELEPSLDASPPKRRKSKRLATATKTAAERQATVKKTATERQTTVKKTAMKNKKTAKKTEDAYLVKVEELAKLKQKQDEDRLDVRLHCFSESCENDEDVDTSPEGFKKMQSLKSINNYTLGKPSDIQGLEDRLFPEVVLCVEIYDSRKIKTQEFLVLGRQLLTELKDKIHCITDQAMIKAGTYDPSGYFLIEDVFHNDLRNPSAIDYSKPILNWLWNSKDEALQKWDYIISGESKKKHKAVLGAAKSVDLPCFGSADMQSTRFCDLKFRLGASYLYCHQGDCKHMIVIRDMRLSHPDDIQNRAVYPRLMFQLKARIQKCDVCKIHRAAKFAVDVKWASENPCYFCDSCLALLDNEEGSLCCDFPVYDYLYDLHRNPLLLDL